MPQRPVLAFALALTLCQAGPATSQSQLSVAAIRTQLPPSARPFVADSVLSANAANATRRFALLEERDGLVHIRTLLTGATIEEQWAYLPEQRVWIEIGIDESGPQVTVDVEYLEQLIAAAPSIHLYHFHPARYFQPGLNATLALALPSPADVDGSIKIAKLQHALNPTAVIRNFVVSPYGTVEYAPTSIGRTRIVAEANHPLADTERDLLTLAAIRRSEFNVMRTLDAHPAASAAGIIADLCAQLSGEFYRVTFHPPG